MTEQQKLKFFKIIANEGFAFSDFTFNKSFDEGHNEIISNVFHKPSENNFKYTFNEGFSNLEVGGWQVEYTPGENFQPVKGFLSFQDFEQILSEFKKWLYVLRKESEAKKYIDSITKINYGISNILLPKISFEEKFNENEIKEIKRELENFKNSLKEFQIEESELKLINSKIDYLIDRTKLAKIDWINIFISTILNLSINSIFTIASNWEYILNIKELLYSIGRMFKFLINIGN